MVCPTALRILVITIIVASSTSAEAQVWWNDSWTWRQRLVMGPAGTTIDQSDVPVMVKLTPSRVPYSTFSGQGADIRFVASDQTTELDYEIETWSSSGTSIIWVRYPTLSSSLTSAGEIWMYWGNAAATDGQQPAAVWKSSYELVWHLQDLSESTDANGNLISFNASPVVGIIGGAYSLDGLDDYLRAPLDLSQWLARATGTVEFWIRSNAPGSSGPHSGATGALMGGHNGANDLHVGWVLAQPVADGFCVSSGGGIGSCVPSVDDTWHHVVFQRSTNGDVRSYLDGNRVGDVAAGGSIESVSYSDLGRIFYFDTGLFGYLAGQLDEVRILSTTVGDSWVRANYRSQSDLLIDWTTCSPATWYRDADGDFFGDATISVATCATPRTGWVTPSTDCDDNNANAHPSAMEVCDPSDVDEDCDGLVDDADPSVTGLMTFFEDVDGDSYGGPAHQRCAPIVGEVTVSGDCNDGNANIHPAATEVCDPSDIDEDCDGAADDADPSATGQMTVFEDVDGDNYGGVSHQRCTALPGEVTVSGDCNDGNASVHPGAIEICDPSDVDEDCDGLSEDADPSVTGLMTFFEDADGDGYGGPMTHERCGAAAGEVVDSGDCNDSNSSVHPGATEVCDPSDVDEDCDGLSEDADPSVTGLMTFFEDADGDGHGGPLTHQRCAAGAGEATISDDCVDTNALVHPGATEVCNELDDDCNGVADDGVCSESGCGCDVQSDGPWSGLVVLGALIGITRRRRWRRVSV